jgi:hypothetical protein
LWNEEEFGMRTLLSVVAALALVVNVYADRTPTHVTAVSGGIGGEVNAPPVQINPGDEIYNTLDIVNSQLYDAGNGDAWSGTGVFGFVYDLQLVDDVEFSEDCCLDTLVRDFLTFIGNTPADGAYVAVYASSNCVPAEAATAVQDGAATSSATFTDTLFGLIGNRLTTSSDGSVCATAGTQFVEQQPKDLSASGDWYYAARDLNVVVGCESYLRDGGKATGGYGWTTWRSGSASGFGAGTVSMAVSVKCGPPTPRCIYQVTKVKSKTNLCGAACTDCPYSRGDLVCTNECQSNDDCRGSLKGFNACSNGSACLVKASLVGCDLPPADCKRCR